ncbi:ribonuclease Z [Malonomonas rubra DSM 5091]|uniref:Ribonuclease Z n=1 Tax=Malonomonas rubra DSM 5091 TaxID=1122189 RepID=A0A1M6B3Z3_MALRU|nr:MBL fold metallo-hydrolase [Malonomonas rubra]SHI43425.1 ribonuclease Z [Malonomonas rubra DSM 5091]
MKPSFPFRNLVPTFFSGLLDDPILLLRIRPTGHHLMFDCGQVHHLAKRTFTHLDAIFISHAHMDHWMGIDSVVRQLIAADKTVDIYGPPGIADKFEHRLRGYDWNLAEDYWSSFRVHEIYPQRLDRTLFSGPDSFDRIPLDPSTREGEVVYGNKYLEVCADSCDHRVESVIYRINERPVYLIDDTKLDELKLKPGAWLGKLKSCFLHQRDFPAELKLTQIDGEDEREIVVSDVPGLVRKLSKPQTSHSIGYISDTGFTPENKEKILRLMQDVDLLICECTFLREAKDRARTSWHLCTDDVNELLAALQPAYFLPMHLSRSYSRRSEELYRELKPPERTCLLKLPLQLTPRPLLANEIKWQEYSEDE